MNKHLDIQFIPANDTVRNFLNPPKPASLFIPEWYKKSEKYMGGESLRVSDYGTNVGLKGCVPFVETLTHGYMIELWTDILVHHEDSEPENNPFLNWTNTPDPVKLRIPELGAKIPRPDDCFDRLFNWNMQWGIKVPKGYSLLYTHPLNRHDLPFSTLSGIIDSDLYSGVGAVPFFVKRGFTGVIPAGTPIVQLIPIKRDHWKSSVNASMTEVIEKQNWSLRTSITGYYRKHFHRKKEFE